MRLDNHTLDDIIDEIHERMRVLRPAVEEVPVLEATLAALNGEEPMNTKQRARKHARRKAHHNESMARTVHKPTHKTAYLNDEQVEAMKQEAKRKKMGLGRMMDKHGYEKDDRGWKVKS